jgi:alcohol dehydrogenase class IV
MLKMKSSLFTGMKQAQILFRRTDTSVIAYKIVTIPAEPIIEIIDQAVDRFRDEHVLAVAGIGGGSVLDAGKAISAMFYKTESVEGYLEGVGTKEHPGTKVPYIAVPTTSGTGSEATKNAVISTTGENAFKKSFHYSPFPNIPPS